MISRRKGQNYPTGKFTAESRAVSSIGRASAFSGFESQAAYGNQRKEIGCLDGCLALVQAVVIQYRIMTDETPLCIRRTPVIHDRTRLSHRGGAGILIGKKGVRNPGAEPTRKPSPRILPTALPELAARGQRPDHP